MSCREVQNLRYNREGIAMTVSRFVLLISFALISLAPPIAMSQQSSPQQTSDERQFAPPASCPVTVPPANQFIPPAPYEPGGDNAFLIGTEKLWTVLRKSGTWGWRPHKPGHEQEVQP